MSRTTILSIWPFRRIEDLMELRNSWGFAPVIWGALSKEYLGHEMRLGEDMEELWQLYKRDDIPLSHRAVLCMTFDNAYISSRNYKEAAAHIDQFLKDFPTTLGRVNHWPEIACMFEKVPDCPAIGFHATSVSERPFQGHWNECIEDYETFDWTKAYNIYNDL